jgi:hypothetical protein
MKRKLASSLLGASVLIMTGCATFVDTTVFPAEGNLYHAVSTSSTESAAMKDGLKKAENTCNKQKKSFIVVSQHTEYHGVDPRMKRMANVASDAAFFSAGAFVPTSGLTSDDDYKVTTVFKCQ